MSDPLLPQGPAAAADPARRGDVEERAAPAPELAEENRLGGSDAGRDVNAALLALSRTARSFTLYDAQNEAVRGFLSDLRAKFRRALDLCGALALEVRPFELAWKGEVVYVERERERSLAFRLFRDGVRRLSFDPELDWDDVLGLVEILSLRYTGVRQQEDDVVTLLHKAAFKHVHFTAVEGFVPDEEIVDDGAAPTGARLAPPREFDLPLPPLPAAVAPAWREIPAHSLQALRAEETPATLPDDVTALALELAALAADPREPDVADELTPTLLEVRDFLIGEGAFAQLCRLADGLAHGPGGDLRPPPALLSQFAGEDALKRVVQAARRARGAPPAEFMAFLRRLPGNPVAAFLDALQAESEAPARAALLEVIESLAPAQAEPVLRRLAEADTRTARELLGVVTRALPDRATDAALLLKDVPDPELQLELLRALQGGSYSSQAGRTVLRLLASGTPEVVLGAAEYLAAHGEQRAFDSIARRLQEAGAQLDTELAGALGAALARLAPQPAQALFVDWLSPRGLLGRIVDSPARRAQQWAAVSGLARLPGDEAEQALRAFLPKSSGDLHRHCLALLVERRRSTQAAGAPGGGRAG